MLGAITNLDIQNYIEQHTTALHPIFTQIEAYTLQHFPQAIQMLTHKVQGNFLQVLCQLLQPKYILELGTFTGYATLCMALASPPHAIVHSIDKDQRASSAAQQFVNAAGVEHKCILHQGLALDLIPQLEHEWDMIYVDADKKNLLAYYQALLPKLSPRGVMLIDNALFGGSVADPLHHKREAVVENIKALNQFIFQDKHVAASLLPLRDGLWLITKKYAEF